MSPRHLDYPVDLKDTELVTVVFIKEVNYRGSVRPVGREMEMDFGNAKSLIKHGQATLKKSVKPKKTDDQ